MLMFYRQLLHLYPATHRQQFGEEMLAVFLEARSDHAKRNCWARIIFSLREIVGLMRGACQEHVHDALGPDLEFSIPTRSFVMRNGFRFPKTTAVLMTLILAGVIVAIQRGEEIATSLPHVNPPIGPIQPVHSTLWPPIVLVLIVFYAAGFAGWAILFALRRSGVHRLAQMSEEVK